MTITADGKVAILSPPQVPAPAASYLVVGFDGTAPSWAALEVATELLRGRVGHLEVVYVGHVPAYATMSSDAITGIRQGFSSIGDQLVSAVRMALDENEPRWHFQRRDGSVSVELVAAAMDLRHQYGVDANIVIVVGSSWRRRHHAIGSVAASLTHEVEFPLLMVPAPTTARTTPGRTLSSSEIITGTQNTA